LPLAKSYFKNSYKNKKYKSGNGIDPIVVGSATPSNGEGCANTTVRNPTRKTEPTNHSFSKKLGQKASLLPRYSEYSFGIFEVRCPEIRAYPTSFIPLPLFTTFPPLYKGPAIPCLLIKIKCTASNTNNAAGKKNT